MIEFTDELNVKLVKSSAEDLDVYQSARVSVLGDNDEIPSDERLEGFVNYMVRSGHHSTLEHSVFTFAVDAPIFVGRQWHRHRMQSLNEQSGRYTELKPKFYIPNADRPLVQIGKPGDYTFEPGTTEQHETAKDIFAVSYRMSWSAYESMLEAGIAKEVARNVLPVSIYTSWWTTLNARSLINILNLRGDQTGVRYPGHPQYEIQIIADKMADIFKEEMPLTYAAWQKYRGV